MVLTNSVKESGQSCKCFNPAILQSFNSHDARCHNLFIRPVEAPVLIIEKEAPARPGDCMNDKASRARVLGRVMMGVLGLAWLAQVDIAAQTNPTPDHPASSGAWTLNKDLS